MNLSSRGVTLKLMLQHVLTVQCYNIKVIDCQTTLQKSNALQVCLSLVQNVHLYDIFNIVTLFEIEVTRYRTGCAQLLKMLVINKHNVY